MLEIIQLWTRSNLAILGVAQVFYLIQQSCRSIKKEQKQKEKGKTYLAPPQAHQPAHLAGPARPPLQRAAWLARQAAKVLGGGTAARHAAARRPASPSRRPDGLDELHVAPRPSWTPPFAPSSSPSRSHAMADATVAAPPP